MSSLALRSTTPRPAARDARPTLAVVERRHASHPILWLVVIMVMLAGAVLGAVSLNALAAADSVDARRLEAEVADAERLHAQLIADVATLDAPQRIRQVALLELGMIEAESPRYVVLGRSLPSDNTGVETPGGDPLKGVLAAER